MLFLPTMAHGSDLRSMVRGWTDTHGVRLEPDVRLDRVALNNSRALAELSGPVPDGASTYLGFLLEKEGVTDAVVHGEAIVVGDRPLSDEVGALLARRLTHDHFTHFGIARSAPTRHHPRGILTVVLVRRLVQLEIRHGRRRYHLCLRKKARRPTLFVTDPGGQLTERVFSPNHPCLPLTPTRPGRYQVESMFDGSHGPEVAALFPLYVGASAPSRPTHKLYPLTNREHVEIRLMHLINRARRARGLSLLKPSGRLAAVARDHSHDMLVGGYFGHRSPTQGDLDQRLVQAGIRCQQASENLAIAVGPGRAHDSLMASPSHRRTLLDPASTLVGVGVATDPSRQLLYVTQILARP